MVDEIKELGQVVDPVQAVAGLVRQASRAGLLMAAAAIGPGLACPNNHFPTEEEIESLLQKTIAENEDIRELVAGDTSRYYFSTRFMTAAFATLLLKKQGDSLLLIADIVRQNAAEYLRPVPLDLFERSPFDFAPGDLLEMLERMEKLEEFRDIKRTTTSASSEFLYSTQFLEPEHASMLAQWLDVGQSENP